MVMRGFCVSNATKMMVRSQWEDDVWLTVYANCARPRMNQYLSMLRQLIRVPSFFLSVAHAKLWNSTIICLCMKKELNIYFSSNQIAIQKFFFESFKKSFVLFLFVVCKQMLLFSPFNANAKENVWCDYESFSQWSTNSIFFC